jgi:peptidoglycan hydrolase-like protein with peptidoglycan-binding domain
MLVVSGARVLVLSALVALAVALGVVSPAEAASQPQQRKASSAPGSLTGYGFDTCNAPPQELMDAWWQSSPYAAVGIYIGGSNRLCQDQPELSADWVRTQQKRGWRVLSLYVGPQASCTTYADRMPADRVAAEALGRSEADAAVAIAKGLGIGKGATLYYDLEYYEIKPDDCRQAALGFLSGWTKELHAQDYDSGVYSSASAAITSLDFANLASPGSYEMPDDIWFALANGQADTHAGEYVTTDAWDDHDRIHQFRTDVTEVYGGYALSIDANWLDVGQGSVPPKDKALCNGVDVDLKRYPTLRAGSRGPAVEAAQCLLRRNRLSSAPITGTYTAKTAAAVEKLQRKTGQKVTGKLSRATWTALLAKGSTPVLKIGLTGTSVERLQRALTAAGKRTSVTGVYTAGTAKAVRKVQKKAGLPGTGVVTRDLWDVLQGR